MAQGRGRLQPTLWRIANGKKQERIAKIKLFRIKKLQSHFLESFHYLRGTNVINNLYLQFTDIS
jgi:hypothetical protein